MDYVLYVVDTETTGFGTECAVLEISMFRMSDGQQRTWFLKPFDTDKIESSALKVNGYLLEDITHKTKEGREKFKDPVKTIVEIENWMSEDNSSTENRLLVGQNSSFDKIMLESLWNKCGNKDTFPFGRRMLDTMQIQFFLDWCKGDLADSYSLNALIKKYGIKNERAHSAEADVRATKELFEKQVETFKKIMDK